MRVLRFALLVTALGALQSGAALLPALPTGPLGAPLLPVDPSHVSVVPDLPVPIDVGIPHVGAASEASPAAPPWVSSSMPAFAPAAALSAVALAGGTGSETLWLARVIWFRLGRRASWLATFASLAVAPLFSRIATPGVLDNPVRNRIRDVVAAAHGISIAEVRRQAGVAWGTSVHHLRRLERHGLVVGVRQGRQRTFYASGSAASRERQALGAVAHPTAMRIAVLVQLRPGIDQKALCVELGIRNPAASKHLGRFERLGLVRRERAGRSCHYHATDELVRALAAGAVCPPAATLSRPPAWHVNARAATPVALAA
ncbi:MAG: winged helix-turn-helix transcriptional regulator [Thermoplasmatota archaeon]